MTESLNGASVETVQDVFQSRTPLSGLDGFGGCLPGNRLVRDVLGREPVYHDPAGEAWGFDPTTLESPVAVPPGAVVPVGNDEPTKVLSFPESTPLSESAAFQNVEAAITSALDSLDDIPIGFSGGVDSTLLATASNGPLYTVGFPECNDVPTAQDTAAHIDRDVTTVSLTVDRLEQLIPEVASAIQRVDAMSVAIAVPLYVLGEAVAADGFDHVVLGQGADELFAGYEKLANPSGDDRMEADSVLEARDHAVATLHNQLERDVLTLRATGIEPITPYLGDDVVKSALTTPESLLVSETSRKVVLRRIAAQRLPEEIASRDKRAVQYGTLTARELDRLARQAGFKRRMGDHVSKYISSRLDQESTTIQSMGDDCG